MVGRGEQGITKIFIVPAHGARVSTRGKSFGVKSNFERSGDQVERNGSVFLRWSYRDFFLSKNSLRRVCIIFVASLDLLEQFGNSCEHREGIGEIFCVRLVMVSLALMGIIEIFGAALFGMKVSWEVEVERFCNYSSWELGLRLLLNWLWIPIKYIFWIRNLYA